MNKNSIEFATKVVSGAFDQINELQESENIISSSFSSSSLQSATSSRKKQYLTDLHQGHDSIKPK